MKFIFVINDVAGKGILQKQLKEEIKEKEYLIYTTKAQGDATSFVKEYIHQNKDEKLCFVACGGDGTINEVFNGAIGHENVYVSIYPCGSGNDFVKMFEKDCFSNIQKIIHSTHCLKMDVLKVEDRYSNNVINFGFDTTVAEKVNLDREKTGHGSKFSYAKGIVKALFTSMKTNAKVYADGKLLNPEGELLLCSFANGQYYGGSFRCASNAKVNDRLIDVCVVKPMSRFKLLSLIRYYMDGKHLENPKLKDYIIYCQAKEVKIKSDTTIAYTIDGEIAYAKEFSIENIPNAIDLLLPSNQ